VAALRRVRAGETGRELTAGLDEIDTAIVARALDARDGRVTIPADLWSAMEFGSLLGELLAGEADRENESLRAMAGDPDWAPLAAVLGRILGGDRDAGLAEGLDDPVHRAAVVTVLGHIGPG